MTDKRTPPKIENAPGLKWRPLKRDRWEARWQCRTDIARAGFPVKGLQLWVGVEPNPDEVDCIQRRCQDFQSEMLMWGKDTPQLGIPFDGTLGGLMAAYRSDADAPYRKVRYKTREHYDSLMRKLENDTWITPQGVTMTMAATPLASIDSRTVLRWHEKWIAGGKVAMSHAVVGMLRGLFSYGSTLLEDPDCERLSAKLHKMRFTSPKPRTERITAAQVVAIREKAHARGWGSIALAQAIQFECLLRQKDVIGEWVPINEPGVSTILSGGNKWLRGIRWEEIARPADGRLILTHVTSKRQKEIEIELTLAPMVMEELARQFPGGLPTSGPVIRSEYDDLPYQAHEYRRRWRKVATAAGVPVTVRNMDSRAGGITEATEAGAELEHIQQAATHGDISMTQRYSRGRAEKTANVMRIRAEHRNKNAS